MQQLTGLDASFLALETTSSTGHVGGLSVLDPKAAPQPLGEIYLITGLAKRRAAVYTKIHHAAIDGASGAELLTVLLALTPAGRELPPVKPGPPEKAPSWPELAARAAAKAAWRPVQTVRITNELVKVLPTLAPAVSTVVGGMLGLNRGDGEVIATTPGRAPATPFNQPITQHRRFAFRSVDLNTVKQIKNAFGVSVNDVVMAMCAGALRRWLADREALPSQPLIAMIPVSGRDPASKGALGNKVSAMLAALPTNVSDPGLRLEIVHQATRIAKAQQAAVPQGLVDQISDFAPPALTARAARVVFATGVLHRLPPFNLTISNVPGPNVPVHLCGARLLAHYPASLPQGTHPPAMVPGPIFAAAVDMFGAGQRLDMRSLARRIGVARATLYRRVGNREQLLAQA